LVFAACGLAFVDFAAEAAGGHSDVLGHSVGYGGFVVYFRSGLFVYEGRLFIAAKSMVNVVLLMTYVVVGAIAFLAENRRPRSCTY